MLKAILRGLVLVVGLSIMSSMAPTGTACGQSSYGRSACGE